MPDPCLCRHIPPCPIPGSCRSWTQACVNIPPVMCMATYPPCPAPLRRLQQLELAIKTQQGDLAGLRVSQALMAVADLELLQVRGGEGKPEQGVCGEGRVL